jgi:uncharacterized protein (TIGR02246 family)
MKSMLIAASIATTLTGPCFAQPPAEASPEMTAVVANDRAFEAAYEKADAGALAGFFTDDAQYTSDDGRILNGRAEIEASMKAAFLTNKGAKLAINVDSVRVLAPEVVLERGATTVTDKTGETNGALYTAIHTKKDGKWKINQLVETPLPDADPGERLAELEWLIGDWEEADKAADLTVRSQYVWARGGNFITRNVTVKRGGNTTLEGWQIVGWDPIAERIHSWTFDSEGGYSEGQWTREGDRWLIRESGVAPDASRTGADNTLTKLGPDRAAWESNNRTLDGEPQPGIARIEINRVKGK